MKGIKIINVELKLSMFTDNMILYIRELRDNQETIGAH